MLFFCAIAAQAGTVKLAWDANTEPTLEGYKVYYKKDSSTYSLLATVIKPGTTYTTPDLPPGNYDFVVTAYDKAGESDFSDKVSKSIQEPEAPTANFNVAPNPPSGTAPLTVTFIDTSTGNVTSWLWSFGDGGSSTTKTAVHTYTSPGNYNASLTVTGPGGSNKSPNKTISVTAAPPVANFSANPPSGNAPLTVQFQNSCTGNVTEYTWNFGDGGTSNQPNPSHIYTKAGNYTVSLVVKGPAGTSTPKSSPITVSPGDPGGGNNGKAGLVAAYSFDEAGGNLVADASKQGNTGTIKGAVRDSQGRFGGALKFAGGRAQNWVTIRNAPSLQFSNAVTMEAWVKSTESPIPNGSSDPSWFGGWRSVLAKEANGGISYYLTACSDRSQPVMGILTAGWHWNKLYGGPSPATGQWVHLAATYNGAQQRLYVNGTEVASKNLSGQILTSNGDLRIGGNSVWGEFFQGFIDEVRIYNRALSPSEIQADMNTPVVISSPPGQLLGGNAAQQATDSATSKAALLSSSSSGEETLGQAVDAIQQGTVKAFQTKTTDTGLITGLQVYVSGGSTGTQLIAGIYSDNQGHPGTLLAQGILSKPETDAWNLVNLAATSVTAGGTYWIAILSPDGVLQIRDNVSGAAQPCETSAQLSLTTLPDTWANGTACSDGPVSAYGVGYR
ncbi:MAG: PKD domain-containing protein [Candidatus Competibacteraceae bacterium]